MIYDCVSFFNELDLLELRLSELDDVVDRFVIVEAPVTHAGKPKPLVFAENRGRFDYWKDRIIHVVVDDMPDDPDPWSRERHQRKSAIRGLINARPDDGIIISDLDEIPRAEAVKLWSPSMGPHKFRQIFCYYWINCIGGYWAGSRILSYEQLLEFGDMEVVRQREFPLLPDGGWHFSFLGGSAAIAEKLECYAHQDLNLSRFKEPRYLSIITSLGLDLFAREGMRFQFCPLDERFPRPVRTQRAKYAHLVREVAFHEDWYADDQLLRVCDALAELSHLEGAVLEIGCWEGRSTIGLAHSCYPETLYAIDTWSGNRDESEHHASVRIARDRDVHGQFLTNIRLLSRGNIIPIRTDCHEFLTSWRRPVKFAHIDASHDYCSVKRIINALVPHVIPGGVLCGDDFLTADASRQDLAGGVERAVRELLPGFEQIHNLWLWRKPVTESKPLPRMMDLSNVSDRPIPSDGISLNSTSDNGTYFYRNSPA